MDPAIQPPDIPQSMPLVDDLNAAEAGAEGAIKSAFHNIALHKQDRNAENAITSCFPVEILERIFLSYAHILFEQRDAFAAGRLLATSHACRLWRDITLRYPDYWTFLPLHYPCWCSQVLKRSNDHPITAWFRIDCDHWSFAWSQDILGQILPRVDTLCVETRTLSDYREFLQGTLTKKAPILSSLKFVNKHGISPQGLLFEGNMPHLQYLDFTESFYEWDGPSALFCSTLTHLSLTGDSRLADEGALEVLRTMSNLEVLRLDIIATLGPIPQPDHHLLPQSRQLVHLRALRILELNGNIRGCYFLAQHLVVQPGLSPRFKFPLLTEQGEPVHQALTGKEATHLISWLQRNHCPHLTDESSSTSIFERPLFSFRFTWNSCLCHGWQRDLNLFYLPIFLHLPLSNVRVLTVSLPSEIGLSSTIQLENFRGLAVKESGGVMFLRWLGKVCTRQETGGKGAMSHVLPALKELRIVGLNLAYEGMGQLIEEFVQQRQVGGEPLESVNLHDCDGIPELLVKNLKELGVIAIESP